MVRRRSQGLRIDFSSVDVEVEITSGKRVTPAFRDPLFALRDIFRRIQAGWFLYSVEDGKITLWCKDNDMASYGFGESFPAALALVYLLCRPDPETGDRSDLESVYRKYAGKTFEIMIGTKRNVCGWACLTRDISVLAVELVELEDLAEGFVPIAEVSSRAADWLGWRNWSHEQIAAMVGVGEASPN